MTAVDDDWAQKLTEALRDYDDEAAVSIVTRIASDWGRARRDLDLAREKMRVLEAKHARTTSFIRALARWIVKRGQDDDVIKGLMNPSYVAGLRDGAVEGAASAARTTGWERLCQAFLNKDDLDASVARELEREDDENDPVRAEPPG